MKVSIIVPIYKVEKTIHKCINSIIDQSYSDIEIILVDDGSPDTCGDICEEFAKNDSRIKVIHKNNEGLSEARNTGLKHITGKYVLFIDSDDFIDKQTVEYLIEKTNEKDYDIVISNYSIIDEDNIITKRKAFENIEFSKKFFSDSKEKFLYFFGKSYGTTAWNKLYKVSFIKECNILFEKNNLIFAEDLLFNMKIFVNMPLIGLINKYTYYYFKNTNSITMSFKENLAKRYIELITSFTSYCEEKNILEENFDLLSYLALNIIDNTFLNSFQYSIKKFKRLREDLNVLKKSDALYYYTNVFLKNRYHKSIPHKTRKIYYNIIAFLYVNNYDFMLLWLVYFRYKIRKR